MQAQAECEIMMQLLHAAYSIIRNIHLFSLKKSDWCQFLMQVQGQHLSCGCCPQTWLRDSTDGTHKNSQVAGPLLPL